MNKLKVGLIQMKVVDNKEENLTRVEEMIREAAGQGVQMVVLPEMFSCPYQTESYPEYAEGEGGPTWQKLSAISREIGVLLVGGSIPVREGDRFYNTCFVFNEQGKQIARHRKIHLFDVDIKGGQ